jgi:hypothetical protein
MLDPTNFNYDWQFLRDFFGIHYLRYLVTWFAIVPIAVVVFGDMPDFLRISLHRDQYLTFRLALPFTWWLLWLSSVLYIVGWSIYVLFGPRFIRRYSHYGAYQAWQHSERWIIWEWYEFLRRSGRPTDVDIPIQTPISPMSRICDDVHARFC